MRDPTPEIANELGLTIARAWTPDDFSDALYVMRSVTRLDLVNSLEKDFKPFEEAIEREPFLVGALRSRAISLGTLALLYGPDHVDRPSEVSEVLNEYLNGLAIGGMTKWETRPEISRSLCDMVCDLLKTSSFAAFNSAVRINSAGKEVQVISWRDTIHINIAFAGHRLRHRISKTVLQSALKTNVEPIYVVRE